MRTTLKRVPLLVTAVRAVRQLPGVSALRRIYADLFPQRVFTTIYRENQWADGESRSGTGSNLTATDTLRRELPGLLRDCKVTSLLDVPCGDFRWMQTVDLTGIRYVGGDIVPDLIAENRAQFGCPDRTFLVLDAARQPVPTVDLILCRDLLIHLSFASIRRVLANFKGSGSTWLAVSTYPECLTNVDVRTGSYHEVNLALAPFHFPPAVRLIQEERSQGAETKYLGLWRVANLP